MMKPVPLTRCAFVAPFAGILNRMGAPGASLLSKFRLPTNIEEKPKQYVALLPALRFVAAAQLSQGIIDFGFLAGRQLAFRHLSPQFQATVRHSPSLLAALESWRRFIQLEDSMLRIRLERHAQSLRVCFVNTFPGADGMPHLEHAQWIQNIMTIYVVREFAGPGWMPETFAFQSRYSPGVEPRSFWPGTRFLSGQYATWIDVPVSLLGLPNRASHRARERSQEPLQPIDTDMVGALKLMLASYLDEFVPSIMEAAEIAGTSARSLQRELAAAGLSYSRLLDQVQFERAAEMLRETDAKIIEVAHATGFENPSHFSRAFRRIAGVTPREFRQSSAAR